MASKLLNTSKKNEKTGSLWTLNRFVHSADIATYTYVEGADASALTGIANSYILDYKQSKCGNHYYVQIVAVTDRWALTDTKQENKNGTIWEFNYRVAKADIATYTYDYGDSADTLTSGTGTYILKWDRVELPNYYLVKVTAVTAGYEDNDDSGTTWASSTKVERSFDEAFVQMLPMFWGAREATKDDVANGLLRFSDSLTCNIGDYIFLDATAASIGTITYDKSPFSNIDSFTNSQINEILYMSLPSVTYTVQFATSSSINNFEDWSGINGSFGTYSPKTTTSGAWLAIHQSVKENVKIGQSYYNVVTRIAKRAPKIFGVQLVWDSDKHGGTWSW